MPIPIFSYGRYQLKTDTFVNTDTDTNMVIADTYINKADTNISVYVWFQPQINEFSGLSDDKKNWIPRYYAS